MRSTSNGANLSAIAEPTLPAPTSSTRRSASEVRVPDTQEPLCAARTKSPNPRSAAIVSPTASSAVDASCTPAAVASATPSGTCASTCSYPALRVWATRRPGTSASRCATSAAPM